MSDKRMTVPMGRFGLFSVLVLFSLVLPGRLALACTSDSECRNGRICDGGLCRDEGARRYKNVCAWGGGISPLFVPGVASSEARRLLNRIGGVVPVDLPDIMTGPVDTAAALIQDQKRLIAFNQEFINSLRARSGEWAVLFVFAHELGHHVNGDVWREDESAALNGARFTRETLADRFATRVLVRLGATLEQTLGAFRVFPMKLEVGQPDFRQREEAVKQEYAAERGKVGERCAPGEELAGGECLARCKTGERREGKTCVARCRTDELFEDGQCRPRCTADERWDADARQCMGRCSGGERWNGARCEPICSTEQELRGGRCTDRCGAEQYWTGSNCSSRCRADERWTGSRCEAHCSAGQEWNGSSCESKCRDDQIWRGNECTDRCREGKEWDGHRCVSTGEPPGSVTMACGCNGYIQFGATRANSDCQSGYETAVACQGFCPAGGAPWALVCR